MAQSAEAEGAKGGVQVVLDRVLAQVVAVADLRDRQPPGPQADDLPLPPGQRRQRQRERRIVPLGRQRTLTARGRPLTGREPALVDVSRRDVMAMAMTEGDGVIGWPGVREGRTRSCTRARSPSPQSPRGPLHRERSERITPSPITPSPRLRPRPAPRSWRRAPRARPAGDASRCGPG